MGIKIYMQFGDIKGDVTEINHKGWVELNSSSYASERSVKQETGSSNRSVSKPSVLSLELTKQMNLSTQGVFKEAHYGTGTDVCIIDFTDDKGIFMRYNLHKAILSDYHVVAISGSDRPHETFKLSFTVIDTRYTPTDGTGSPSSAGYDISKGTNL